MHGLVVVVVAVEAKQVVGAAAAQVIGAQVPPKIPHWTVHWAEPANTSYVKREPRQRSTTTTRGTLVYLVQHMSSL